jgi:hypothetical protein
VTSEFIVTHRSGRILLDLHPDIAAQLAWLLDRESVNRTGVQIGKGLALLVQQARVNSGQPEAERVA